MNQRRGQSAADKKKAAAEAAVKEEEAKPQLPVPDRRQNKREEDRWAKWDKRLRDLVIFGMGVGSLYRIFILGAESDPVIVAGSFLLCGLPFAFGADGLLTRKKENGS